MYGFHKGFYGMLRSLIKPYFKTIGRYRYDVFTPQSDTYLVLTNHNTNWDFFLFGLCLRKHMYFVASEHIFRLGFTSSIIKFLADPIPRKKGASSDDTVRIIKERLADGKNVCMMAEGNRSFNGETGFISPATAKLVKESGVGLLTAALHGGYFVNPRWASEKRNGPMRGSIVNEYTAEELKRMSENEVYEAICRDLYVNAYEDQLKNPNRYKCRHPAEHLETALFLCPECHSFSALESSGDKFFCRECGMKLKIDDYGYFESTDVKPAKFKTVLEWDKWQQSFLHDYLPKHKGDTENPLFSDEGIRISSVQTGKASTLLAVGQLAIYGDRLEVRGEEKCISFPLSSIKKLSIALTDTMLFTTADGYYELKGQKTYPALKYLIAWRLLTEKEYI